MLHIAGPSRATLRDFRIVGIWNSKSKIRPPGSRIGNVCGLFTFQGNLFGRPTGSSWGRLRAGPATTGMHACMQ